MGKNFQATPSYKKGLIGEEIIKKYLEEKNYSVRRPKDTAPSGSSVVDFIAEMPDHSKRLIEVKVKSPQPYAYGRFPVYKFPKNQIHLYKNYSQKQARPLDIFIVDEERERIFSAELATLENEFRLDDKIFPVEIENKYGISRGYFFGYSVEQFDCVGKIDFSDLEKLHAIKFSDADKKLFKPLSKSVENISVEDLLMESRAVLLKYLNVNLSDDLPTECKKISALIKSLRPKFDEIPTCLLTEIYHAVHNLSMEKEMPTFANQFYSTLDEIRHERQKTSYKWTGAVKPETPAKKIAELQAPNNSFIKIFEIEGNEPSFFVEMFKLADAFDYERENLVLSNLGDAIKAVSNFYTISCEDKKYPVVPVKDFSAIMNEYAFNREDEVAKYEAAKNFLAWWEQAAAPYVESPLEENLPDEPLTAEELDDIKAEIKRLQQDLNRLMKRLGM